MAATGPPFLKSLALLHHTHTQSQKDRKEFDIYKTKEEDREKDGREVGGGGGG